MRLRIAALVVLCLALLIVVRSHSIRASDIWQQLKDDVEMIQYRFQGIDWKRHYSKLKAIYREKAGKRQAEVDPMLQALEKQQQKAIERKDWSSVEKIQRLIEARKKELSMKHTASPGSSRVTVQ